MAWIDHPDPTELYLTALRRKLAEETVALAAKHFPYEREWPEIVYEDILDAEVIDD